MAKTHIVIPDPHAHPNYHNDRAVLAGRLVADVKPDVVVNLGDTADMPSLCSYDKGKGSFIGRKYRLDIEAHSDWQDRMWSTVRKQKRKLPRRITLIGNHEERIGRAVNMQPELEGTIGYEDLELNYWYDDVIHYAGGTPGTVVVDGILYAHYCITGVSGRPISGEHAAYSLLSKQYHSCVVGHLHTADLCIRHRGDGQRIIGLVAGCFQDYFSDYAGEANDLWWRGAIILRNVEDGSFDPEFVSIERLQKEYGN